MIYRPLGLRSRAFGGLALLGLGAAVEHEADDHAADGDTHEVGAEAFAEGGALLDGEGHGLIRCRLEEEFERAAKVRQI